MQPRSNQTNQSAVAHRAFKNSSVLCAGTILLLGAVCGLEGCGSGGIPPDYTGTTGGGGSTGPTTSNNWELTVTAQTPGTTGSLSDAITLLSGSIVTQGGSVDAVFRATTKGCYSNSPIIPLLGTSDGTKFTASSFNVKGQYLHLTNGLLDATRSHLTGSYDVGGGCSQGESGTFTGTRFASLTGTYKGTPTGSTSPITVTLTQSASPTGEASFILTGGATVSGSSCFPSGTIPTAGGYVSGSAVTLSFTGASSNAGTLVLNGTVTSDAATITVPAANYSACGGNVGALTLTRQ